ncbi:MAG TPA: DUF883 family protein [Terriglobales bacterium]|nr:DUF883 family protein [Terriglobales bacterium]
MNDFTTQRLISDVKVLIDDAEELVRATADQTGERIMDLRQRLQRKIEEGRDALAAQENEWRQKAEQARERSENYLRENVWASVAMAAGLGLLLGLLLRRD